MAYDFELASNFRVAPTPVPEPATILLVATAVVAWRVRRIAA